ncbi:hypothetical protein ACI2OX_17235 [Bacillus sp. N9]
MEEIGKMAEADKIFELTNSYIEKGKEIGKEEGKEIGKEIGIKEGKKELGKEIALDLLRKGWDIDSISKSLVWKKLS